MSGSARFRRDSRLTSEESFRRVLTRGKRKRAQHIDIVWADNRAGHPRLGLVVPKFQSTAVARNRLRRRLKELWRREMMAQIPSFDVILRARRETYLARFSDLRSDLHGWAAQLGTARQ